MRVIYTKCLGCGEQIAPNLNARNPKRWCSEKCRLRAYRAKNPTYVKRQGELAARRYRESYVPLVHELECFVCRVKFQGRRKDRKYCSQSCANRAYNAARRADGRAADIAALRRALERGAKIKDGRRSAVLERDQWICHLCEFPTNREAVYPAPDYPVIDHVVPLSKGGEHSEENWKVAHNRCNSKRRDLTVEEFRLLA